MASPFEVLGVDPDADEDEIRQAYRERVKQAHPDHGGSVREFQLVRRAYEELKSGGKRDVADIDLAEEGTTGAPAEPESESEGEREEERVPSDATHVEYLNYEVLDDRGWDIGDEDLFEKAADAGLDPDDYGRFLAEPDETLLEAAENRGFAWPYACRGGACANCAVMITKGDLSMPVDHILPEQMTDRGIRLSCVGSPTTDEIQVIYNVKHLPGLDELRLPPRPFEQAN